MRVRVAHVLHGCRTLGPGERVVVWVAGCERGCRGCVAAPINGRDAGRTFEVHELLEIVFRGGVPEGLTLSGGEPFEQAQALAELCALARARVDLSILAFSGFRREELAADTATAALLAHLDVLIDGRFVAERRADLRWRGSPNQRIHLLSGRHAGDAWVTGADESAGVELHIDEDGRMLWAGVAPAGFAESLHTALRVRGIEQHAIEEPWS